MIPADALRALDDRIRGREQWAERTAGGAGTFFFTLGQSS